jgi:predicted transposase YbfD/YdcC
MPGLKGNQGALHDDVQLYLDDPQLRVGCAYHKAVDKAHGAVETCEYWQTLEQGNAWAGFASIVMTKNTVIRGGDTVTEVRYFISSLALNAEEAARAIRSHWMAESYHWRLDVAFREDANYTPDKAAAYNLNIMKKTAINTLRLMDVGIAGISMKNKRYLISMNFKRYLDILMAL